jgi:hypothetical protein
MEVCLKFRKKKIDNNKLELIKNFILFLQGEFPLKKDVTVIFTSESEGNMTTGLNKEGTLKVLFDGRMLIDVLRTLAHEWVHEHQFQYKRSKGKQDIGGPDENEANAESGKLMKLFAKQNPEKENSLYE